MEDKISLYEHLTTPTKEESSRLNWFEKLLIGSTLFFAMPFIENAQKKHRLIKSRMRNFKPIIKRNFWGTEYIEWVGRDKPLTDEELNKII